MVSIRAFLGIRLSESNQEVIDRYENEIKMLIPAGLNWVDPINIHLTIKFLGSTPPDYLTKLIHELEKELNQSHHFILSFSSLNAFPNIKRPRVIWVGVKITPELQRLAKIVEETTEKIGFQSESRTSSPHITIARIKKSLGNLEIISIGEQLLKIKPPQLEDQLVKNMSLIKSDLRSTGPIYSCIHEFTFS